MAPDPRLKLLILLGEMVVEEGLEPPTLKGFQAITAEIVLLQSIQKHTKEKLLSPLISPRLP